MHKFLAGLLVVLMAALFGCGGGSSPTAAPNTVSGVAAAGAPIIGKIYLKDSATAPKEMTYDTTDGSYSFDVSGMTKPFILKAVGVANGVGYTLYSVSSDKGTANINPMTHLVVANASVGADMTALYGAPTAAAMQSLSAKVAQAVLDVQTSLKTLLQTCSAEAIDPITGAYKADHTGLDGVLDIVKIDISNGTVTITNKATTSVIFTAQVANVKSGTVDITKISQVFTRAMISGKTIKQTFTDGVRVMTFNPDGTIIVSGISSASGTWTVNANGKLVITFAADSLTYTLLANNATSLIISYHHGASTVEEATGVAVPLTTSAGFTTGLLTGKSFAFVISSSGSTGTITFNADGSFSAVGTGTSDSFAGTWVILPSGQLVITSINSGKINTITLLGSTANAITAYTVWTNPTDSTDHGSSTATFTITTAPVAAKGFTAAMVSGKSFTWTSSDGASGTATFNANGTVTRTKIGAATSSANWSINASGIMTVVSFTSGEVDVVVLTSSTTTTFNVINGWANGINNTSGSNTMTFTLI
jgi:hypothetical protein